MLASLWTLAYPSSIFERQECAIEQGPDHQKKALPLCCCFEWFAVLESSDTGPKAACTPGSEDLRVSWVKIVILSLDSKGQDQLHIFLEIIWDSDLMLS